MTAQRIYADEAEISRSREPANPADSIDAMEWTMDEFDAMEFPPARHLIKPWLPQNGLAMIAGWRGTGKTFTAAGIALAVAAGVQFLNWEVPEAQRVLYVDGEMDPAEMRDDRLRRMRGALSPEARERVRENLFFLSHHVFPETGIPDLSDPESLGRKIVERVAERRNVKLIILDNLSSLCKSGIENDAESWASMQDWLLKLRRAGYTVLFMHHGGKPDGSGRSKQRGTSKREDVLNVSIMLQRLAGMPKDTFEWEFTKNRGFLPEEPFPVTIGAAGWVTRSDTVAETADRDGQIRALANRNISQRDIAAQIGCSPSLVNKVLKKTAVAGEAGPAEARSQKAVAELTCSPHLLN
jgi:putative DNA primase/helicase